MIILKPPDFSKQRSKAIISDGTQEYPISVELCSLQVPARVDFSSRCIQIDENLSTEEMAILFEHEKEHLNKYYLAPIWILSRTGKYQPLFDGEKWEKIRKELDKEFQKIGNKKLKTYGVALDLMLPNTFDNIVEDLFINKHLIQEHEIPEEDLDGLGARDLHELIKIVSELFLKFFKDGDVRKLEEHIKRIPQKSSIPLGMAINNLGDICHCYQEKINPISFCENAIKEVESFEKKFNSDDIFDEAMQYKFGVEKFRLKKNKLLFEVLKENPDILPNLLILKLERRYPELKEYKKVFTEIVKNFYNSPLHKRVIELLKNESKL